MLLTVPTACHKFDDWRAQSGITDRSILINTASPSAVLVPQYSTALYLLPFRCPFCVLSTFRFALFFRPEASSVKPMTHMPDIAADRPQETWTLSVVGVFCVQKWQRIFLLLISVVWQTRTTIIITRQQTLSSEINLVFHLGAIVSSTIISSCYSARQLSAQRCPTTITQRSYHKMPN